MTNYQSGDVVFTEFPSLVILDVGDSDVLLSQITTEPPNSMFDVALADWHQAGLRFPSIARLHKLATLDKTLIHQRLGSISKSDRQHIATVLPQIIAVWQFL